MNSEAEDIFRNLIYSDGTTQFSEPKAPTEKNIFYQPNSDLKVMTARGDSQRGLKRVLGSRLRKLPIRNLISYGYRVRFSWVIFVHVTSVTPPQNETPQSHMSDNK
jgi:hypothetical protein